jgi:hypothetical protein
MSPRSHIQARVAGGQAMHFAKRPKQDPIIFRLLSSFFGDEAHGNGNPTPFSNRTVAILLALAAVVILLFGLARGFIPK